MLRRSVTTLAVFMLAAAGGCADRGEPVHVRWNSERGFHSGVASLPADAEVVAEGQPPLTYLNQRAGTLYVFDITSDSLIHTADMDDAGGALFVLDAHQKALLARPLAQKDQDVVLAEPIDPSHRFSMRFRPAPSALSAPSAPAAQ